MTLPAYITTTRCAVSATTPIAWVISMIAMPKRCFMSDSRSRICAWMVTSSAVVGSSAISSFGVQAALANAAGELVRKVGHALVGIRDLHEPQHLDRLVERSLAREPLVPPQHFGDLLADRVDRIERGHRLLEHHCDVLGADAV